MSELPLPKHLRSNPNPLTRDEIEYAYVIWRTRFQISTREVDLVESNAKLRSARVALMHSCKSAADRLRCSTTNWQKLERAEEEGSITLASLIKAAEAIDCEFSYSVKPKGGMSLSRSLFSRLLESTRNHRYLFKCAEARRADVLAKLIADKLRTVKYRREQGLRKKLEF